MTTTKLPPDSELATPVVGDKPSADLQAKLTDDKQRHKRARFKALILPRLKEVKFRMKQVKNCGNRSNYVYTENEAKAVLKFLENQIDEIHEVFCEYGKDYNAQPIQFDTTEFD
jgi:hypothetical protein